MSTEKREGDSITLFLSIKEQTPLSKHGFSQAYSLFTTVNSSSANRDCLVTIAATSTDVEAMFPGRELTGWAKIIRTQNIGPQILSWYFH